MQVFGDWQSVHRETRDIVSECKRFKLRHRRECQLFVRQSDRYELIYHLSPRFSSSFSLLNRSERPNDITCELCDAVWQWAVGLYVLRQHRL